MSTLISRIRNFVTDKTNGVKITASYTDSEFDQIITALNRKVLCASSAPGSPIAGQTWFDTTNKILKVYRSNEWVGIGALHVSATAPSTPQEGDLWYKTSTNQLNIYNGSSWDLTGATDDMVIRGFELVYNNTTSVKVNPGTLSHGSTRINKTAITTLTLATAADWWDGAVDDYVGGAGWCYIGVDVSGNIKLLGANPPSKADTAGNTDGTLLYWYDTSLYWRVIGAVRVHTDNTILLKFYQFGNKVIYDDVFANSNVEVLTAGSQVSFTDVSCAIAVPAISRLASFIMQSAADLQAHLRVNGSSATSGYFFTFVNVGYIAIEDIPLDSSQVLEYKVTTSNISHGYVKGYTLLIR